MLNMPTTDRQPVADATAASTSTAQPARSYWASSVFSVLKFNVGKTEWAAPLVLLECVAQVPTAVTVLPGQPHWHLGLVSLRNKTRVVVDLARFLSRDNPPANLQSGFLIALGDGECMLQCDVLGEAARIQPETVRWRRSHGTPWLAGILPDSLSVLLDVDWLLAQIRHD